MKHANYLMCAHIRILIQFFVLEALGIPIYAHNHFSLKLLEFQYMLIILKNAIISYEKSMCARSQTNWNLNITFYMVFNIEWCTNTESYLIDFTSWNRDILWLRHHVVQLRLQRARRHLDGFQPHVCLDLLWGLCIEKYNNIIQEIDVRVKSIKLKCKNRFQNDFVDVRAHPHSDLFPCSSWNEF